MAELEHTLPLLQQKNRNRTETVRDDGKRFIEYHDEPGRWYRADGAPIPESEARAIIGAPAVLSAIKRRKVLELKRKKLQELEEFEADLDKRTLEEIQALEKAAQVIDADTIARIGGELNAKGQLRETRLLKAVHVAGQFEVWLKSTEKNVPPPPESGQKLAERMPAADAVAWMLNYHADDEAGGV